MAHKEGDDQHYLEEDNDKKMEIRTKLGMGMRVGGETHLTVVDEHCSLSSHQGKLYLMNFTFRKERNSGKGSDIA